MYGMITEWLLLWTQKIGVNVTSSAQFRTCPLSCSLSPCLEQQRLFPVAALLAPALGGIEITGLPGQKVRQVASERGGHLGSWFCLSVNSLFIDVGQGSK